MAKLAELGEVLIQAKWCRYRIAVTIRQMAALAFKCGDPFASARSCSYGHHPSRFTRMV